MKFACSVIAICLSLAACSGAPPDIVNEPACTRRVDSTIDGRQITLKEGLRFGRYDFRFNKVAISKYNRYPELDDISGKTATILCTEIAPGLGVPETVVAIQVEGLSEPLFTRNAVILPLLNDQDESAEVENALATLIAFAGKDVWAKPGIWAYKTLSPAPLNLVIPNNLEKLKVLSVESHKDIVSGYQIHLAFQRPSGERIFQTYPSLAPVSDFESNWHMIDPRDQFPDWPEELWRKIETGNVEIGMTADMVEMALGLPRDMNSMRSSDDFTSQWVYGSIQSGYSYYYFRNGILESFQY